MEISLKLVYDANIKMLGVTGTYPSKDNCYKVLIETKEASWEDHYVPKPVYDMLVKLKKIKGKLSRGEMKKLIDIFNEWGDWKYEQGALEELMNDPST